MTTAGIFLLPNGTFFVELIVFIVLIVIIGKKIIPPINAAMAERQERIRASLDAADQARADASAADDERRAVLEEARQTAREVVAQANRTAEAVRVDAQTRGQAEFERIVGGAEAEVARARQRAVEEAANRLGEIAMDVVERVIGRPVSAEAHQDLIAEAVSALRADAAARGRQFRSPPVTNFIIELVVSLVLLYFIWKKVGPAAPAAMAKKQEQIRVSLEAADQARADALAADDERHAALEETRRTAQEIVAQANRTAEAVRVDAQARGEAEYERIVGSAETEVALARQRAVEEAANRLGEIVMDVVERVIAREVNAEAHHDLIDEAVSALNADATGERGRQFRGPPVNPTLAGVRRGHSRGRRFGRRRCAPRPGRLTSNRLSSWSWPTGP